MNIDTDRAEAIADAGADPIGELNESEPTRARALAQKALAAEGTTARVTAMAAGVVAFQEGIDRDACPFPDDPLRDEWLWGFDLAGKADKEARDREALETMPEWEARRRGLHWYQQGSMA